jgi:hypothetical protein
MDISDQEQKVKDIANAAWTPEVRQAYETFKAEQANRLGAHNAYYTKWAQLAYRPQCITEQLLLMR